MLWSWRMMQKFRGIAFYDPVHIMHAELMLIYQQTIRRPFAFEKSDGSRGSRERADERSDQQRDDAEMRDQERKMMFAPRPAGESGDGEVRAEQNEPEIKPRRAVNVGASDLRIETRFVNRSRDRGDDQHR